MILIAPVAAPIPPCVGFGDCIPAALLDALEAQAALASERGGTGEWKSKRRSKVRWLEPGPIYDVLGTLVAKVNAAHFHFDISGFGENLQLARYEAEDEGCYDWHQDFNADISRKLSVTVQLTHGEQYDGGELEINTGGNALYAPRERGSVIVFPSFQLHRVKPVTRGVRHSLVAWVSGPAFR